MGKRPKRVSSREKTITSHGQAVAESFVTSFMSPESSTIQEASYDPDTEILRITFRAATSKEYIYDKVPRPLWIDFEQAPSKGKFFDARIRPFFTGARMGA